MSLVVVDVVAVVGVVCVVVVVVSDTSFNVCVCARHMRMNWQEP